MNTRFNTALACASMLAILGSPCAIAQVASTADITSVDYTITTEPGTPYTQTSTNGTPYNITYSGERATINSFTTGSVATNDLTTYRPLDYSGSVTTVLVRNATQSATKNNDNNVGYHLRGSLNGQNLSLRGVFHRSETTLFNDNNLFTGTDNLFANQGNSSGNNNNIERVDVIFHEGLVVTEALAFFIMERGASNGHDGFQISAILGYDVELGVTEFGEALAFANGSYGKTNLYPGDSNASWDVSRNPVSGDEEELTHVSAQVSNQNIGGTTVAVAGNGTNNLGVSIGQTIYGYSLFGIDVNTSDLEALLDIYSSAYALDTEESNGGIDLTAYTGVAVFAVPVPEPSTYALLGAGLLLGAWMRRRRSVA